MLLPHWTLDIVGMNTEVYLRLKINSPCCFNPFNPKYLEWYSLTLDMEHTIQVCRCERVNALRISAQTNIIFLVHFN